MPAYAGGIAKLYLVALSLVVDGVCCKGIEAAEPRLISNMCFSIRSRSSVVSSFKGMFPALLTVERFATV